MASRLTQRDIARAAGVSQTAVSLVLGGKGGQHGIIPQTERRILSAARQLGYTSNVTAQALRGGRNQLIAVHTFERLFPTEAGHYYYEFMVGIEQQAMRAGQDLVLLTSVHGEHSDDRIYSDRTNRLQIADGAVILGYQESDNELAELAAQQFPFVMIGRRRAAKLMPYVAADYGDGTDRIAQLLTDRGHRTVAYLGFSRRTGPRQERLDGLSRALADRGGKLVKPRFVDKSTDVTADTVTELRNGGATAVMIESAPLAEPVATACRSAGVEIPGDLGAVVLDGPVWLPSRDWATMMTPKRALGALAFDVLIRLMDEECARDHHEQVPCEIETGETLRPVAEMPRRRTG